MKRAILLLMILSFIIIGGNKGTAYDEVDLAGDNIPESDVYVAVQVSAPVPVITIKPDVEPGPPHEIEPIRVTVVAAGDLMCLYAQLNAARKKGEYRFDYCFDEIRDRISEADLAICNFETLVAEGYIYTRPSPPKGSPKMNAPESYLEAAVNCGFDVFINANNHILDREVDGLDKTIGVLNKSGVLHTGAYATGETREQLIADIKGIKIAVLSYTANVNGRSDYETMVDKYSEELVTADISAAKAAGVDYIIVYMHWGSENTHKVNKGQKKAAAHIAEAGADIIIGSHSHCIQEAQIIETGHGPVPVFYSLGNLVSSMTRTINRDSALVNIVLEKDNGTGITTLAGLTYTPTYCADTSAGRFVILPADLQSVEKSRSGALKSSRARTVKVLADKAAVPE